MPALYPYQTEGAAFLAARRRAMLADEQGLGKTAQAIQAANLVDADPVLVVCPASVVSSWRGDIARFATPGRRFVVASYDRVTRQPAEYEDLWGAVILDEAHYLKSPSAKRTMTIYGSRRMPGILRLAGHVWALTGTPAPNYPVEMYTHMRTLFPESLRMASDPARTYDHDNFVQRYCVLRDTGFGAKVVGAKNTEDLRARLQPHVLRRLKRDVLPDLPEIRYEPLLFDAPGLVASLAEIPAGEMAAAREALKSGAGGLQALAMQLATLRRVTALAKAEVLRQWIIEFLEQTDRKLVVFGHHREPLDYLRSKVGVWFRKSDEGTYWLPAIFGNTRQDQRADAIRRFQEDPRQRVFFGQIQAAGTGITLTAASDLVFLEQSWSPADNAQAAQRIHRIGQKSGCLVRYAMLAGSIDEAVQTVLARKSSDLSKIFD